MAINNKNLINTIGVITGQRVLIVDGVAYAIGVGSVLPPGGIVSEAIAYQNSETVKFADRTFYTVDSPVTNINCTIPAGIKNAQCRFTTGSEITFSFNIPSSYKINEVISLLPNTSYVFTVDNGVILWTSLIDSEV